MKVITLISGGDIGGAKTHVLSLLHGLGKTEQVRLVCFREGEFAEDARKLGIDTCVMEVSVGAAIGRLTQMIREEGFQIIHCHGARANLTGAILRRCSLPLNRKCLQHLLQNRYRRFHRSDVLYS